jgi:peptide/nickel transport system ATP-binding protein
VLLASRHPYTQALTGCVVRGSYRDLTLGELSGSPPDLSQLPPGCSFAPRCSQRVDECGRVDPLGRECHHRHMVSCVKVEAYAGL